jgi:hypothetical protein
MQIKKVIVDAWGTIRCPFCAATYEVRMEPPFDEDRERWRIVRIDADTDCRHRGIAIRLADGRFKIPFVKG